MMPVVASSPPGDDDPGKSPAEVLAEQGNGQPARNDEDRPFEGMPVPVEPEPDPYEIREAIAHAQPEQEPERVGAADLPGAEQKIKPAVIHQEIQQPAE